MSNHKHQLPEFLFGRVTGELYRKWLNRKAAAHIKRDRKRVSQEIFGRDYRDQIHQAVQASGGYDWYTGEALEWEKISSYNNEESKLGKSIYKAGLALLPTVDHVFTDEGGYRFVICGWRTNDAKNDLNLSEFLNLCRMVIANHGNLSN